MSVRRARSWWLLLGLLLGCDFGEASSVGEQNSCMVDTDCPSQRCEANRCVMTRSEVPMNFTLVVTPKRMPDGSQPFPIVTQSFPLQTGQLSFALKLPVSVPVRIYDSDGPIAAQVTFTPQLPATAMALAKATQINTVVPAPGRDSTDSATLLSDIDYTVMIQPVDGRRPPHSLQFNPSNDAELDLDYTQLIGQTRRFRIHNARSGNYNVRARAKSNGQLVSNTRAINVSSIGTSTVTALATLTFDSGSVPYVLELTPISDTPYSAHDAADCNAETSIAPVLTIDASSLVPDRVQPDLLEVELPQVPDPVLYSGEVQLCANQKITGSVPVSLKSRALSFGGSSKMFSGSFEASTTADWDDDTGALHFCARVLPGDYVVVVTPPANVNCEIFAERRPITAPIRVPSADGASQDDAKLESSLDDDALDLRTPATLSGNVVTPDRVPMANASINLLALGTSDITLAETDPTVPTFNRSAQVASSPDGAFKVPVDVGTYDMIVKPPAQSNFAWRILYNVDVGARTQFATEIVLKAPIVVNGNLSYLAGSRTDQSTLAGAEVRAFTVVDEADPPNARSIEIARAQADSTGKVTLLLPPELQKSWTPL